MAILGEWEMRQVLKDGDRKGKGGQGLHEVWRTRTQEKLMHRRSDLGFHRCLRGLMMPTLPS